jgi:hypothetical protein
MKTTILYSLVLLTMLTLLIARCKQDPIDPLPPATQEGRSTIGCYIDGTVWRPYSNDILKQSTVARYLAKEKTLFIGGFNNSQSRGFAIALSDYTGQTGTYMLDSLCEDLPRVCANVGVFSFSPSLSNSDSYYTSKPHTGTVIITKHTPDFVSGTFSFEAQNRKTGKVARITEGRFDMPYITYQ